MDTMVDRRLKWVNWPASVMFALGFWLSASLVLDLVILPGLFASGMMAGAGFASAGYLIFGIFNHIELVCAAIVLAGFLVFHYHRRLPPPQGSRSIALAGILLAIALLYTYLFTPQMSGLGMPLDLFSGNDAMPSGMASLHGAYWGLEGIKLLAGSTLLRWCYRDSCPIG